MAYDFWHILVYVMKLPNQNKVKKVTALTVIKNIIHILNLLNISMSIYIPMYF